MCLVSLWLPIEASPHGNASIFLRLERFKIINHSDFCRAVMISPNRYRLWIFIQVIFIPIDVLFRLSIFGLNDSKVITNACDIYEVV